MTYNLYAGFFVSCVCVTVSVCVCLCYYLYAVSPTCSTTMDPSPKRCLYEANVLYAGYLMTYDLYIAMPDMPTLTHSA